MTEIWKDIKGYEGKYQVSSCGQVRTIERDIVMKNGGPRHIRGKIKAQTSDKDGYLLVKLKDKGIERTFKVHRLVAAAFIENPNNYPTINHKDEDKKNNNVENLEWCTRYYNNHYSNLIERMVDGSRVPCLAFYPDGKVELYRSVADAGRATGDGKAVSTQHARTGTPSARGYRYRKFADYLPLEA